jgi:hypothetical protein
MGVQVDTTQNLLLKQIAKISVIVKMELLDGKPSRGDL